MNNSLPRLIDGMVQTLQKEIIPHIDGDYARGQAYGVIYMLNSIKLRASWSCGFLLEQLRALDEAKRSIQTLSVDLPGAPILATASPPFVDDAAALESARDNGDKELCDFID